MGSFILFKLPNLFNYFNRVSFKMADEQAAQALFKFFDDNADGGLSFEELKEGMASVGSKYTDADIRAFFDKYDADKNGIIDFKEFIALCMSLNDSDTEKAVAKLFSAVDKDGDKSLTHAELREGISHYTGKPLDDAETTALIKQLDIDGDGEISYLEFTSNMLMKISCAVGENAAKK